MNELTWEERYDEAVGYVKRAQMVSVSFIQRRLRIGYVAAARIVDRMEKEGLVTTSDPTSGMREVLVRNDAELNLPGEVDHE